MQLTSGSSDAKRAVDVAEAKAEDQNGPEFDPLAKGNTELDEPEDRDRSESTRESEIGEVAEKEQGGQEFEPLKPKRIIDEK